MLKLEAELLCANQECEKKIKQTDGSRTAEVSQLRIVEEFCIKLKESDLLQLLGTLRGKGHQLERSSSKPQSTVALSAATLILEEVHLATQYM